jgi:hypothetical protein
MEEAIINRLLATAGVTALVGTRVYPGARTQGSSLPALVFNRISGVRDYTMTEASGQVESRVQIDAWAVSYAAAKTLARAVRACLSGIKGTYSGVAIQGVFLDGERDTFEGEAPDRIYRVSMDFNVWAVEA